MPSNIFGVWSVVFRTHFSGILKLSHNVYRLTLPIPHISIIPHWKTVSFNVFQNTWLINVFKNIAVVKTMKKNNAHAYIYDLIFHESRSSKMHLKKLLYRTAGVSRGKLGRARSLKTWRATSGRYRLGFRAKLKIPWKRMALRPCGTLKVCINQRRRRKKVQHDFPAAAARSSPTDPAGASWRSSLRSRAYHYKA